jgi:hypothetical protein
LAGAKELSNKVLGHVLGICSKTLNFFFVNENGKSFAWFKKNVNL